MDINYKDKIASEQESLKNVETHLQNLSTEKIKAEQDLRLKPYAVAMIDCSGNLNIGMTVRNCCLLGAKELLLFGRKRWDARSSVGGENYIKIKQYQVFTSFGEQSYDSVASIIMRSKYYPVFIEQGSYQYPNSETYNDIDGMAEQINKIPLFIFGNEGTGIPQELIDFFVYPLCPYKILAYGAHMSLPQIGVMLSYNVSIAASIILYNYCSFKGWLND